LIWRACPILDMEGLPHSWYVITSYSLYGKFCYVSLWNTCQRSRRHGVLS
jgi:hypothetical protein